MVVMAMWLNAENIEHVERFESSEMQANLVWMKPLLDLSIAQGADYYIVVTYSFKNTAFVRESLAILRADHFFDNYVFVEEGKKGFSKAVRREEI